MRIVSILSSVLVLVSFFISDKVHANESHDKSIVSAPDRGIVHNKKEASALVYYCERTSSHELYCEFTQSRIQKKVKRADLKTQLDEAQRMFQSDKKELEHELSKLTESCKEINETSLVLQGRKKGKNVEQQEWINNISDMEKNDSIKMIQVLTTFCNSKTLENHLNVIRAAFDRESRTCSVSSNNWRQSFRLVEDQVSGAFTWVAKGEPAGACGVIQLSRFEPEPDSSIFWKYIAKKAVTNKQGILFPGMSCNDLDENEYVFEWKSKEHALGCDYISFSP